MIYMIVWSGGYEAPSYDIKATLTEALAQARKWAEDIDEDQGDWIDVLEINTETLAVNRVGIT